jgi:hypothetical protein
MKESMDKFEKYHFDLKGYLLVEGILDPETTRQCLAAVDALEDRIVRNIDDGPFFVGHFGLRYNFDEELGCSSYQTNHGGGGVQYVVDDFLNAAPEFDVLVGHERTMAYVREFVEGPIRLNSSEIRYRHRGNITGSHMGGPMDVRNRYQFAGAVEGESGLRRTHGRDFDLLTIRALYALHDLPSDNGALCVVPGSHKANYYSPYAGDPMGEPGMIPLPMKAGDVLFFTENLRHGGFPNHLDRVRKTLHLCFGPDWVGSQSPAHWNAEIHVTENAWGRYNEKQRALLPPPGAGHLIRPGTESTGGGAVLQTIQRLQNEIAELTRRNHTLEDRNHTLEEELQVARNDAGRRRGFFWRASR